MCKRISAAFQRARSVSMEQSLVDMEQTFVHCTGTVGAADTVVDTSIASTTAGKTHGVLTHRELRLFEKPQLQLQGPKLKRHVVPCI